MCFYTFIGGKPFVIEIFNVQEIREIKFFLIFFYEKCLQLYVKSLYFFLMNFKKNQNINSKNNLIKMLNNVHLSVHTPRTGAKSEQQIRQNFNIFFFSLKYDDRKA